MYLRSMQVEARNDQESQGNMSKLAYTIVEAADQASVEMATVVRAIQDGELRARRVENDMRVLHADLSTWLDGCPNWVTGPA